MDRRPAPVVTISDPNQPVRPLDALGHQTPVRRTAAIRSWRLSRWQRRSLIGAVLLAVLSGPPALYLRHRSLDAARDRQDLRSVQLSLVDADVEFPGTQDGALLLLRNDGPQALHVTSERVDVAGSPAHPLDLTVQHGERLEVTVPLPEQCPSRPPVARPGSVQITVTTARGQHRTLRIDTSDSGFAARYAFAQQRTCALYPLDSSLEAFVRSVALHGRELAVQVRFENLTALPRELISVGTGQGFHVTLDTPLPLRFAPAGPGAPTHQDVLLHLRVASCIAARLDTQQVITPASDGTSLPLGSPQHITKEQLQALTPAALQALRVVVGDGAERATTEVFLQDPTAAAPTGLPVGSLLAASC